MWRIFLMIPVLMMFSGPTAAEEPTVGSAAPVEIRTMAELGALPDGTKAVRLLGLGNEAILEIAKFDGLQELEIYASAGITDAGVQPLRAHPTLRRLVFEYAEIGDEGFALLATLPELEALHIEGNGMLTDAGIKRLKAFPSLRALGLNNCGNITAQGLLAAEFPPHLTEFDLRLTHVTDALLARLAKIPYLASVKVWRKQDITDEGIKALSKAKDLREIELTECDGISAKGVALFKRLKNLDRLAIGHNPKLGDATAKAAGRMRLLRRLELPSSGLTDDSLKSIGKLKALEHLDLAGNKRLSRGPLRTLVGRLTHLRTLKLRGCQVTDKTLAAAGALTDLEALDIVGSPDVTGQGIARLGALPKLRTLNVSNCTGINDAAIAGLAGISSLKLVYAWDCAGVKDETFQALIRARPDMVVEWKWEDD